MFALMTFLKHCSKLAFFVPVCDPKNFLQVAGLAILQYNKILQNVDLQMMCQYRYKMDNFFQNSLMFSNGTYMHPYASHYDNRLLVIGSNTSDAV